MNGAKEAVPTVAIHFRSGHSRGTKALFSFFSMTALISDARFPSGTSFASSRFRSCGSMAVSAFIFPVSISSHKDRQC